LIEALLYNEYPFD
jgi:hypothetical protein